jgi:peptidoglycan hydrolase-like protein with peptidoglycan-binding domain
MITSSRKIVAGLLSTAMVLTSVVGLTASAFADSTTTTTTTTTASTTFTRNLTVGSRGSDVTALQTILASKGYLMVSPTGYFGTLTKRALAAWQAAAGISPAVGYFGPITRAALATSGTTTVTTTGTVGCPSGAMYNYMTGALCTSTGGSTTTSTTEGTLTVQSSPSVTTNANILTSADVPVWGVQLLAKLAPVTVSRIDLDIADIINSSPTSIENPGNFINTIKVWDGTTLVKSWSVGTADFITGTSATDYYVRLSGLNYVVPAGQTKQLVVSFTTNGGIDTSRTLTIKGYGSNSLLAVSGNNVNSYYDISPVTGPSAITQTFQKPGVATLTVGIDATNPVSTTNYVDSTSGATSASALAFNAYSNSGDSMVTEVDAQVHTQGTAPSSVELWTGSTRLSAMSVSGASTTVAFTNLSDIVKMSTTKVYSLKFNYPSTVVANSIASTTVTYVTYQKPNGSSAVVNAFITGNDQSFFSATPNLAFVSGTAVAGPANTSGSTQSLSGTITFKVTPQGGSMVLPVANDFRISAGSSLANANQATSTTLVVTDPSGNQVTTGPLSQNTTYTLALSGVVSNGAGALTSSNNYTFYLTSASTTVNNANGVGIASTVGTTTLSSFRTNSVLFNK